MNIVVLAGGLSPERNVSLTSGAMVCRALRQRGHRTALVDLFFGIEGRGVTCAGELFDAPIPDEYGTVRPAPDLEQVRQERQDRSASLFGPGVLELCALADIVFLALHGMCGEDGRVQAAFDLLGIPYTGSGYMSSALALDKDMTKRLVANRPGVDTPRWETVDWAVQKPEEVAARTALPVVVKPLDSGSSIGVYIARTRQELLDAITTEYEVDVAVASADLERFLTALDGAGLLEK
jgi:D-alanine-D-alanine ligase